MTSLNDGIKMTDDLSRFGNLRCILLKFFIAIILLLVVPESYAQKIDKDELAKKVKKVAEYVQNAKMNPIEHSQIDAYNPNYKPPAEENNPEYRGIYAEIGYGTMFRIKLDNKTYQNPEFKQQPLYAKKGFSRIRISAGSGGENIQFEDWNLDGKLDNFSTGYSVDPKKDKYNLFRFNLDELIKFYETRINEYNTYQKPIILADILQDPSRQKQVVMYNQNYKADGEPINQYRGIHAVISASGFRYDVVLDNKSWGTSTGSHWEVIKTWVYSKSMRRITIIVNGMQFVDEGANGSLEPYGTSQNNELYMQHIDNLLRFYGER